MNLCPPGTKCYWWTLDDNRLWLVFALILVLAVVVAILRWRERSP